LAITVVVFSVAHFGFGLGARTSSEFAILANGGTCTAGSVTFFGLDAIICLAVTIVVFAIADFGLWFLCITEDPASCHTRFLSFTANGLTGLFVPIDLTVTVIVFAVTGFGFWFGCITAAPRAILAELDA
jgi:lysozyme family protein